MGLLSRGCMLLAVSVCVQAGPARASCGTAECPLDLSSFGDLGAVESHWASRLGLRAAWEYIAQDQPRYGSEKVLFGQIARPDHDEIETINRNMRFLLDFNLTQRWTFEMGVPLISRSHSHFEVPGQGNDGHDHVHGGGEVHWNFTRLGDVNLWARYAPRIAGDQQHTWLRLGLGLGVPTGSTAVRNSDGVRAEPTLQPGRGAWGIAVEVEGGWQPQKGNKKSPRLFVSGFYRYNFSGRRQYRFGNEALVHAGGQYPLWRRLEALLQLSGRFSGRDEAGRTGERTDATGGRAVFLGPGLQLALVDGLSLYAYYQWPLYQHVNQVQLSADRNLLIGLNYRFKLL